MSFKKTEISELKFNPFDLIGKKWMLITGGNKEKFNTMTASWGQMGVLWNKNVATCYIRSNRYTYDFVENGEMFTLSFFGEEHRKALQICGTKSGRDCDKVKETGLTPIEIDSCMAFDEAEMVIVCKKLHSQEISTENFCVPELAEQFYGSDPKHTQYIAEIVSVYVKE